MTGTFSLRRALLPAAALVLSAGVYFTPLPAQAQVTAFYARVRQDPLLGPIFNRHVTDWPAHEDRIAAFWRNAILYERGYSGNPQRVHIERPDVKPEMFAHWLDLFEEVAHGTLPPETATPWVALRP